MALFIDKIAGKPILIDAQPTSEKSTANGYASLGATAKVPTAELGSGSASSSTFLRGDQTWAAPATSGAVQALLRERFV